MLLMKILKLKGFFSSEALWSDFAYESLIKLKRGLQKTKLYFLYRV